VSEALAHDPVARRIKEATERIRSDVELQERVRRIHNAVNVGILPNGERRPMRDLEHLVDGLI
jgi:hypothetical protein